MQVAALEVDAAVAARQVVMTWAPAALKVEWPETYSGNGGVTTRSSW